MPGRTAPSSSLPCIQGAQQLRGHSALSASAYLSAHYTCSAAAMNDMRAVAQAGLLRVPAGWLGRHRRCPAPAGRRAAPAGCHSPASIASSHFFAFSAAQNPGVGRQPDSRRLRDRTLLLGLCVSTQAHVAAIRGAPPEEVYKMECSLGNVGAAQPDIAEPACADGVCVSSGPDSRSPDGAACVYSCEPAGCCTAGR